jgi:hypothetical protein
LVNTDGNGSKTIQGNTFSNWNAETGVITAMNINTVGTNNTIANNAINTITSAGLWNYYCCRERQYFFEYN